MVLLRSLQAKPATRNVPEVALQGLHHVLNPSLLQLLAHLLHTTLLKILVLLESERVVLRHIEPV